LSARFVANTRCVVFFVIFPLLLFEDKTTLVQVIRQGGFGWVNTFIRHTYLYQIELF
jgi:hypothetical protein